MPKPPVENDTARLEAGIPVARGAEDAATMRLARADSVRFAEALIDPPKPDARLIRAAKRHAELIERH